ncbi:PilZ domain-containing protein [Desulfovibrio inopinatus]|uniref:PilZ domain-containing protein n=1 Tax=Desulfovibrio inopinatus TaxID=102109 RepID=UPI0003FA5CF5|nr:PilZ domain-containing protein [Desulfovibrio inopinatus]
MIWDFFKQKQDKADYTPDEIYTILDQAIGLRSRLRFSFTEAISSLKSIECEIVKVSSTSLVVHILNIRKALPKWAGQPVLCYLQTQERSPKKRTRIVIFKFTCTILEVLEGATLRLSFPENFTLDQRRNSVRIEPSLSKFSMLSIFTQSNTKNLSLNLPLATLDDFKNQSASLINFSAGGMRVRFKSDRLHNLRHYAEPGKQIILRLAVAETPRNGVMECLLIGRVNNLYANPVNHNIDLGIEFLQQGFIGEKNIRWKAVKHYVVEDVAGWTGQWDLESLQQRK